jgi:hypothetical protein
MKNSGYLKSTIGKTRSSRDCWKYYMVTIYVCDCRRGVVWWMDLLTTYIRHSELNVITEMSLISTLYKSPQHTLILFQACCIFNSHLLAMASSSWDSSASRAHVVTVWLISRILVLVNCQINHSAICSQPICRARLNCQPSTNWVPGWQPFNANLLVFFSQADFQLTTELSHLPTSYSLN